MWNMRWRARLRRFRLPEDALIRSELWARCQTAFGNAAKLPGVMTQVEAQIGH
jgi:hypothetical protein